MENNIIISNLFNKYLLNDNEINEIKKIITPIVSSEEFKNRMTNLYPHHGKITLGEHIIEDAIVTYKLSKKQRIKNKNYRIDLAIEIAMFHDLYTIPWQNNKESKVNYFFHKHGFRHPIEAIINSINWYPEYFNNINDTKIIIDGVLHHMFPLPVLAFKDNVSNLELKNTSLYNNLSNWQKEVICESLQRKRLGSISISRSRYKEGKIMSKADRIVSRHQIKDFRSLKSLVTGHNKNI